MKFSSKTTVGFSRKSMLKCTPYVGSCARGSHVSLIICVPSNWRHIVVARYHLIGDTCMARYHLIGDTRIFRFLYVYHLIGDT